MTTTPLILPNGKRPSGSLISHFSQWISRSGGINLAQGKPGFPPPPELVEHLRAVSFQPENHQYAPGNGNTALLSLLAAHLEKNGETKISRDHLLVVQGATEGIFLSLFHLSHVLEGSFSVLAFDPVYESYPRLPDIMGMPFHHFPTQRNGDVDFNHLHTLVRGENVRIILLASPGNPLGKIWTRSEINTLLDIMDTTNGWLIFDAVYSGLYFADPPPDPLSFGYPRMIYVDAFSKRLSITGWRVGFMAAPPPIMKELRSVHDFTGLSASSLAQEALVHYLEENDFGSAYTRACAKTCAGNHAHMSRELENLGFQVAPATGGYFVWARCPESNANGYLLAEALISAGVGVVPGENFSARYRDHIRLNIATDSATVSEAADLIRNYMTGER